MAKERFQNPVLGDDLTLRMFTYNSNNRTNISQIDSVGIFFLDRENISEDNPDGRRLVHTVVPNEITLVEVGQYAFTIHLEQAEYTLGKYIDEWNVFFEEYQPISTVIDNNFEIHPDLWYADTLPIVYDFSYTFRPNKIRKGSKRFLIINITPNVPKATDLARYYNNLAIVSPLKVYIEMECVECMPSEEDLRMVVCGEEITYREMCSGFYMLDTCDMECGIYNVWFEMEFGESIHISDKQQLQIF